MIINKSDINVTNKLFSTGISTLIAEICTLPICTIKTVYQNNNLTTLETIKNINKQNGFKGFFSASTPAIISQIFSTTSKFTIYEYIKNKRNTSKDDIINNSLNGGISGLLGSLLTHPIDVWKNFSQRNESYKNFLLNKDKSLIKKIYQGYSGSISKNIVLYSCLYPINDYYNSHFKSTIISAPLTTITVSFIIQPFDYYKTIKIAKGTQIKVSLKNNYFRGFHLMLLRSMPHFMLTMYFSNLFYNKFTN